MKKVLVFIFVCLATITATAQEPTRCRYMTRWGQCTNETNYKTDTLCIQHKQLVKMEAAAGKTAQTSQSVQTSRQTTSRPKTKTPTVGMQCVATTKSGKRCSRTAAFGSRYCWQHGR